MVQRPVVSSSPLYIYGRLHDLRESLKGSHFRLLKMPEPSPVDRPVEDSRTSKYLDLSLESTKLVLTTLKDVAGFAPVPFLAQAANLALGVLDMAQLTKNNKDGFKNLARDCCGLVYAIVRTLEATSEASALKNNPHDPALAEHVHELTETLKQIQILTTVASSRHWPSRFIFSKLDAQKIQEYQRMLGSAMQKFGVCFLFYLVYGIPTRNISFNPTCQLGPRCPEWLRSRAKY
ncbi:hypothetical protein BD779DRAFT_1525232 [Infundibulicybe gibba]|nr:hypothetical protein BD779DRAFT_1525232 [Infundibulicybe gibba]